MRTSKILMSVTCVAFLICIISIKTTHAVSTLSKVGEFCSWNGDCGIRAHCVNKGRSAKCECLPGFATDSWAADECRWKCKSDKDCASTGVCRHQRCVDYCNGVKCTNNELCLFWENTYKCICKSTLVPKNGDSC